MNMKKLAGFLWVFGVMTAFALGLVAGAQPARAQSRHAEVAPTHSLTPPPATPADDDEDNCCCIDATNYGCQACGTQASCSYTWTDRATCARVGLGCCPNNVCGH